MRQGTAGGGEHAVTPRRSVHVLLTEPVGHELVPRAECAVTGNRQPRSIDVVAGEAMTAVQSARGGGVYIYSRDPGAVHKARRLPDGKAMYPHPGSLRERSLFCATASGHENSGAR